MAIHHQCTCGAKIRMRDSAAGKRAKCSTCGAVFRVPEPEGDKPYGWLEEFSRSEAEAASESVSAPPILTEPPDAVELSEPEPDVAQLPIGDAHPFHTEDREWIKGPEQPFWRDLLGAFFVFMTPGNLITLLVIAFLNAWMIPLSYAGILGLLGMIIIYGYLCAFCLATIRDAAAGEDELPTVWISSVFDDLVVPLLEFVGSWLLVLVPAALLAMWSFSSQGQVAWGAVRTLMVVGLLFWPVVILCVALGSGFRGLWPHVVVRTALGAPLAYLAVCATLGVAGGLTLLPSTDVFQDFVDRILPGAVFKVAIFNAVLSAYAMIVAMRAIGLFYRHFKRRFPWVAE